MPSILEDLISEFPDKEWDWRQLSRNPSISVECKLHLCEVISKSGDEVKVKRCSDGKHVQVSMKKIRI